MKRFPITLCAILFAGMPLAAKSGFFPELSDPLFDYCDRLERSMLLKQDEGAFIFGQCVQSREDDEKTALSEMEPTQYLASLRRLDKAYHKSLWQVHLLLRSAIETDDGELFQRIVDMEERRVFNMNGILPHALDFMARHRMEIPYYINPNIGTSVFRHDWKPGMSENEKTENKE